MTTGREAEPLPAGSKLILQAGPFSRALLVTGYLRAFYRLQAHHDADRTYPAEAAAYDNAVLALFETLNWADSLLQFLRDTPAEEGGIPGWVEDELDPAETEIVLGFDLLRNAVHHDWWTGIDVEMTTRLGPHRWVWPKLESFPSDPLSGTKRLRAYESALARKPVMETLTALRDIFWKHRGWRIGREDLDQPDYPLPPDAPFDDGAFSRLTPRVEDDISWPE